MSRFAYISIFSCAVFVQGQSPGNGISKTTMACNDPIAGKEWMYKYFPVATPGDECTDDICTCPAGTGGDTTWYIQQGRVYALESDDYEANSPDISDGALRGRRMPSPGNGFGMHLVNLTNHLTTGGLSVAQVEAHFTKKLGDMSDFDSFMDFNAFFYTTGLADYVSTFKADGVGMYTTTWTYDSQTWTSVFVHVPNTQLTIELCQNTTLDAELVGENVPRHAIARASPSAIAKALAIDSSTSGAIISPLAVNRAVSATAMAKIEDFYVTGFKTTKVDDISDADDTVTKKCFLWTGATVDVCFYLRDKSETKGSWKVEDFEDMLNTVHTHFLKKTPLCGEDKWFDNHYAIDSRTTDTSNIISYVEENNVLHYCEAGMFGGTTMHYAFDPTGWGIQLDLSLRTAPSDCSSAAASAAWSRSLSTGHSNPACDPGTCS